MGNSCLRGYLWNMTGEFKSPVPFCKMIVKDLDMPQVVYSTLARVPMPGYVANQKRGFAKQGKAGLILIDDSFLAPK